MNLLFTLDEHNYTDDMPLVERFAVRAVICRNGKYAMQKSRDGEYKMPGGGREDGESLEDALIREIREEVGLVVRPETIREIGEVVEMRRDKFDPNAKYIAHSYFYSCDVENKTVPTEMTESELRLGYEPSWASLDEIIRVNDHLGLEPWQIRDNQFLKWYKETQNA